MRATSSLTSADRAEMIIVVKQLSIICVQLTMTIKLTKFIHNAQQTSLSVRIRMRINWTINSAVNDTNTTVV